MPAPAVALSLMMLAADPSARGLPDLHKVACKLAINDVCQDGKASAAGNGGKGGDGTVVYNLYFGASPQGGNGGNGGGTKSASASAGPSTASAAAPSSSARVSLALRRCTLSIAGKPEVDTKGCQFEKTERQFTLTGQSVNQKYTYTMKVALNEDKTGRGTLSGGRTTAVRDLGPLTRKGACWVREGDIEICAWK